MCEKEMNMELDVSNNNFDDAKKIRQQRIYEFKLKQGYLYMRDIMILNIIAFMEMILFMILSMLIWIKFTSFSGEDYIRFILTAGVVAEILIYMLNEKFIKWFSKRRFSWIRKQIKNIK